jgi:Flp pilus assembly protein TadG
MALTPKPIFIRGQSGVAAIEFAIILPVFLVLLLGIMDTGRLFWAYTTLKSASEAAARCYAIQAAACTTLAAVQNYAVTQAGGLTINASAFTATIQTCGKQVSGTYIFAFVIPWLSPGSPFGSSNSITLTAATCYPA